ncbi:protein kinase domain-containing protein [Sinomonas soli]
MDAASPSGADRPPADDAAEPGARDQPAAVPGYETLRAIGRGAAGPVWLVREAGTGRLLAAKLLVPGPGLGPDEVLARAQREARISRARPHDHVLGIHRAVPAAGAADGAVALLSEYAAGGSLGHLVRVRGRLPVGECITVVVPIARALAALHADGTAHGDVSPGNVLFTADGRPMLSDFGLGRMVGDGGAGAAGTAGFADPSAGRTAAAEGGDPVGSPGRSSAARAAAADVFALGALAWYALTGEPPVQTEHRPPLSLMVRDVPAELAAAIEAALRDDPLQRPSAEELARSVLRSGRAEPVDLAPAVDAAVLPELMTRRQAAPARRRPLLGLPSRRDSRVRPPRPRLQRPQRRRRAHAASASRAAAPAPAGRPGARRRRPIPAAALWLAAGLVVAAVAAGWWSRPPAPPGGDQPAAADQTAVVVGWDSLPEQLRRRAAAPDPVQAVQALSEIRARAIAGRDRGMLSAVNAAGSEAAAADRGLLDRLEASGQRLEGFSARVLAASLDSGTGDPAAGSRSAAVRVRVVTTGYAVKDRTGATVGERPAGRDQELTVVLEHDGQRWKVARIGPA